MVRNVDETNNSRRAITYQVEANVYYKEHVERIRIDVCNLRKTKVILGILWLQAHNLEINQETREVKMTRCLPLCNKVGQKKEEKKVKRGKRVVTLKKEKIIRQIIDNKEDQEKKEEIEENHKKIEELVPRRFLKWRKVFGQVELERMSTRKIWDYVIDLKEMFKPQKERIYSLSKNKREEVQNFMEDQLKKGYIKPSKSPQMSLVMTWQND